MSRNRLVAAVFAALTVLAAPASARAQNVLVVYYSATGHTRLMAEAVADGARAAVGAEVRLRTTAEASVEDLRWADAVILGSPVRTGNPAPEVLNFLSSMPFDGSMKDKVGAAFASGGGISAGEETTQLAILHGMLVYGMVVVGGPEWTGAFGASAVTEEGFGSGGPPQPGAAPAVDPRFLAKGHALGQRVAEVAARLTA